MTDPWTLSELIEDFSDDPDDLLVKVRVDGELRDFTVDYGQTDDGADAVVLVPAEAKA